MAIVGASVVTLLPNPHRRAMRRAVAANAVGAGAAAMLTELKNKDVPQEHGTRTTRNGPSSGAGGCHAAWQEARAWRCFDPVLGRLHRAVHFHHPGIR